MINEPYRKSIGIWLITGLVLVLTMVVIGGITRLTHSGLSIVTWQPITGIFPPMNEAEWQQAFDAYKQIPEYKRVHFYFTLNDFKHIYFWEYLHRMIGRSLGLVFFIPYIYFLWTKKIKTRRLHLRLLLILGLGTLQGFAGWYMVKSGLVERTSVDHWRLALHMSLALAVLSTIFWTVLELFFPAPKLSGRKKGLNAIRWLIALIILQIIYGGLTAGLKAGYVFPTYPKMGIHWFPPIILKTLSRQGLRIWFEYAPAVQFIHRWLGTLLALIVPFVLWKIYRKSRTNKSLRRAALIGLMLVLWQYSLGVMVLISRVKIGFAVIHQLSAFLLFLSVLTVYYFMLHQNRSYEK